MELVQEDNQPVKLTVEWNNCFICINDLSKSGVGKCPPEQVFVLLDYLLDKRKGNLGLVDEIKNLMNDGGNGPPLKICDCCENEVIKFTQLQLELVEAQRKLTSLLDHVKAKVKDNSKENGDGRLEMFKEWLNTEENKIVGLEGTEKHRLEYQKRIFKALNAFQDAVNRKGAPLPGNRVKEEEMEVSSGNEDSLLPDPFALLQLVETTSSLPLDTAPQLFHDKKVVKVGSKSKTLPTESKPLKKRKKSLRAAPKEPSPPPPSARPGRKTSQRKTTSNADTEKNANSKLSTYSLRNDPLYCYKYVPETYPGKTKPKPLNGCVVPGCPFKGKNVYNLEEHLRSHEVMPHEIPVNNPLFRCEFCENRIFTCAPNYHLHMASHSERYSIICEVCGQKLPAFDYNQHLRTHSESIVACANCSYCCVSRSKYIDHLLNHPKGTFQCDICKIVLSKRKSLLAHYDKSHNAIQLTVCGFEGCNKTFRDPLTLKTHRRGHKQCHTCNQCGKVMLHKKGLEMHMRKHTGETPYACTECEERFPLKAQLERHLILIHGAPRFQCNFCEKSFVDKARLTCHISEYHSDNPGHPCEKCGRVCLSKRKLEHHMQSHKEERDHVCDICGASFRFKHIWKRHMETHGTEKKFKCDECGKSFLFRRYLDDHKRTHTGEKPYVCDQCGKAFAQQCAIRFHKRKIHQEPPSTSRGRRQAKTPQQNPMIQALKSDTPMETESNK